MFLGEVKALKAREGGLDPQVVCLAVFRGAPRRAVANIRATIGLAEVGGLIDSATSECH